MATIELHTIQYVLAVAETGSFSQAAQECYVGQPALSQQIAKLERELGVKLFNRSSRGITLTEAGEEFVLRGREILQHVEALQSEMYLYAGLEKGLLNIGIITSLQCIDFGGMLSAFCGTHANISINIEQAGTYTLLDRLVERSLDLAFLNAPTSKLPPSLEFTKLGQDYYSLAVPRTHRLAGREWVSLSELKHERFIFHQKGQVAAELCWTACRDAGFEPDVVCRSASPSTGLSMVRSGLGVAFLPSEEFRKSNSPDIAELRIKEPIIKEVGLAKRKDVSSPVLDAMVEFVRDWVRH